MSIFFYSYPSISLRSCVSVSLYIYIPFRVRVFLPTYLVSHVQLLFAAPIIHVAAPISMFLYSLDVVESFCLLSLSPMLMFLVHSLFLWLFFSPSPSLGDEFGTETAIEAARVEKDAREELGRQQRTHERTRQ